VTQLCNFTIQSHQVLLLIQIRSRLQSLSTFFAPDGFKRVGITRAFLKSMFEQGSTRKARIFVKNLNFDMRNDVPLLMVSPGTGIVPFIAFS